MTITIDRVAEKVVEMLTAALTAKNSLEVDWSSPDKVDLCILWKDPEARKAVEQKVRKDFFSNLYGPFQRRNGGSPAYNVLLELRLEADDDRLFMIPTFSVDITYGSSSRRLLGDFTCTTNIDIPTNLQMFLSNYGDP